jgi:hypothetical protein
MQKMHKNKNETPLQAQKQRSLFFFEKKIRKLMLVLLNVSALKAVKKRMEYVVFSSMSKTFERQMLQCGKQESFLAFCIVHWNAPDFLLLNVSQLELLYPNCCIFVLDNGSRHEDVTEVRKKLKQFNNVTLFSAELKPWSLLRIFGLDSVFLSYHPHSIGLQFLLNYAAKQKIETAVFLDQDCVLNRRIDQLIQKLNKDIWLVGARDYVLIPKDYGPIRKGELLRYASNMIHVSFMILKPVQIRQLFGDLAIIEEGSAIKLYQRAHAQPFEVVEPYYGISIRTAGRIFFLETKMHDTIPLLTSYSSQGIIYAWHAWFSSRTTGFSSQQTIDGCFPVSWLLETRKTTLEFMKHINEETTLEPNKTSAT